MNNNENKKSRFCKHVIYLGLVLLYHCERNRHKKSNISYRCMRIILLFQQKIKFKKQVVIIQMKTIEFVRYHYHFLCT